MAVNIGPRIGIEGEEEYRKAINGIIEQSKTLNSEMKALSSSFDAENKSLKDNAAQRKLLNEQIENQEKRVEELSKMLEKSKSAYGENAIQTQKWQQAVNEAQADLNKMNADLRELPNSIELVGEKMKGVGDKIKSTGDEIAKFGKGMTRNVTAPIVSAFTLAVKESVNFESAFTGVMKTVDETSQTTYADLEEAVKKLASTTASSKEEVAAVMEAAGQLGVAADDVEGFTRTMIMLGDTTNLSADEAATALARFTNITGSGNTNVDRLGSAIVALGNNFATTEAEIVEMSTRLASAGSIAGMSETDILALSAAMSSVGIQAEAGGTAMTQTLKSISNAVFNFKDGFTEDLETIAGVAGTTAEDFAAAWEANPVQALQMFINGLAGIKDEGANVFATLDAMGMSGIRQSNMLQSLAMASDTLAGAISTASTAYQENTALTDEANKRYATMETQLHMMKESVSNLALSFGEQLMPYLQQGIDFVQGLVDKFSALSEEDQQMIIKIAALAAAIGPILVIGGKLAAGIGSIISLAGTLTTALAGVSVPILPIIAIIGAVIAVGVLLYKNWDKICEWAGKLGDKISETWNKIKDWTSNLKDSVVEKWNGIKDGASRAADNLKTHVSNRLSNIKSAFENNGGGIKGIVSAGWEAIKGYYADGFSVLNKLTGGKLGEIWDAFKGKFDDLKTAALDWGKGIIENIVGGIKQKIDLLKSIVDTVKNVISGIWDALTGKENKDSLGAVNDATADIANTLRQSTARSAMAAGVAATGRGSVSNVTNNNATIGGATINVYASEGMDVRSIAREIQDVMTNDMSARRAVFA